MTPPMTDARPNALEAVHDRMIKAMWLAYNQHGGEMGPVITAVLDNLPRLLMASLINGQTSLTMKQSIVLADRLASEIKREILG